MPATSRVSRLNADVVMPGHSRSKNGVASLAYVPGIHALTATHIKDVDGRDKPGYDVGMH